MSAAAFGTFVADVFAGLVEYVDGIGLQRRKALAHPGCYVHDGGYDRSSDPSSRAYGIRVHTCTPISSSVSTSAPNTLNFTQMPSLKL